MNRLEWGCKAEEKKQLSIALVTLFLKVCPENKVIKTKILLQTPNSCLARQLCVLFLVFLPLSSLLSSLCAVVRGRFLHENANTGEIRYDKRQKTRVIKLKRI